jgi:primosomal protein N' (replication factor Y)
MHIIEVIPIARGVGAETLSYFCPVPMQLGSVIEIPVRKKIIQGVVVAVREAVEMKSDLKQASFSLKKIATEDALKARPFFTKEFMSTARQAGEYYAATVGSVLAALVPELILSKTAELHAEPASKEKKEVAQAAAPVESANIDIKTEVKPEIKPQPKPASQTDQKPELRATPYRKNFFELHAIQGDDEERFGSYRGLIRQEFARKSSVLVLVPTAEEAERAYELLEKGIEGYAHVLHSALSKKKIIDTWNQIVDEEHPVAIVATGSFLSIPRKDIGAIILEKENGRGWKQLRRPYADIRQVAELYAKERNIPLFLGDMFLSVETLWRQSEDEIIAGAPFKFRTLSTSRDVLIDMRQYKSDGAAFKILSEPAEELIQKTKADSEHMIIFALRRGHAPSVVCADCQTIVTCNECSKPVVLHRAPAKAGAAARSFFLCHRCGARRSSEETCKNCGSWKLATVGIGIDLVAEKIRDKFPGIKLFQIDSDTTPNEKQARATVAAFRAQPGAVLIGTEMMLSYLHEKVENALIVSLDSLLSIPDFRIHEKILNILLSVRSLARREVIIQTRKADEKIFDYALKGNLNEFFRAALLERKTFSYPPFSTLIKLTLEGEKDAIVAEMGQIKKTLEEISTAHAAAPYAVDIFPAFTHTVRGNFVLHGLIRIPRVSATVSRPNWPDAKLSAALRGLPPSVTVNIDPDTLL